MKLQPIFDKIEESDYQRCAQCTRRQSIAQFIETSSPFYPSGRIPICNDCVNTFLQKGGNSWDLIDKLCQFIDVPFLPENIEQLKQKNAVGFFPIYANMMFRDYGGMDWKTYEDKYKALESAGTIEQILPRIGEQRRLELKTKWGANYDDEALDYLEHLYIGLNNTQNISGALSADQALKLCKISYEIDRRISAGEEFDKILGSYDKLVKIAEFTPKNAKNVNDFDSVGELFKWCEKKGWHNKFYDRVTRDIVDESMKNIEAYNQRLYTNESGIGDEIQKRIEQLKTVEEMEHLYDTDKTYDLDTYQADSYAEATEEFHADLEEEAKNDGPKQD